MQSFVKKFLKSKKGDLPLASTVTGTVIAVLVVIGLLILGGMLFGIFKQETQAKQAKNNLNELTTKMSVLKEGENFESPLLSPSGWLLTSWPINIGEKNYIPKQCVDSAWTNCLCMCPYSKNEEKGFIDKLKSQLTTEMIEDLILAPNEVYKYLIGSGENIEKACEAKAVCVYVDKPTTVESSDFDPSVAVLGAQLAKAVGLLQVEDLIDSLQRKLERRVSISVNELVKNQKNINVTLENNKYHIKPEKNE